MKIIKSQCQGYADTLAGVWDIQVPCRNAWNAESSGIEQVSSD